ncbi:MAG: two-component system response regulator NarL [Gammaproteobacteria bacterium]|nr:two-component system response regulator NarL [Gammaproteobacteria bacterium]
MNTSDALERYEAVSRPWRLLLVDDHPMLRRGVRDLLSLEADLVIAGEAGSGQEAIQLAQELQPDLILLDLNMRGMDGLMTLQAMRDADIDARILIFTVSDDQDDLVAAIRAGADGYVLKDSDPALLVRYIRDVLEGQTAVSDRLAAKLAQALRMPVDVTQRTLEALTRREQQILRLIARGMSNKMIARELDIAEGTVKVHVKNLLKKLGMRSRVEVAVWTLEHKLG